MLDIFGMVDMLIICQYFSFVNASANYQLGIITLASIMNHRRN